VADPGKGIAGWAPPPFRFAGLGMAPTVAHSDIVTSSLAGSGVATTAARSDVLTAILTTKGAILLGGTASTVGALAVGTNTQALVADSTQTFGVKWAGDTAWTNLTLSANWSGAGFSVPGYRKDALGFVHLRGVVIVGAGAANPLATMPAGYRPSQDTYVPTLAGASGISLGSTLGMKELSIATATGQIAGSVAVNDYVMLDGLTWLGEV
jgi:hypothetical protein